MKIYVNNQSHEIAASSNVLDMMQALLGDGIQGIAVAVNDTLIPRSQHASHILQENDQVLMIKAAQGG